MKKNENLATALYREIEQVMNKLKSFTSITLTSGDFNAKVGKRTDDDAKIRFLGSFSRGNRNRSGELLVEFCEKNKLFICNSAFQNHVRHITTWSQTRVNKETNRVKHIYNQIDYVMMMRSYTHNLTYARSYAGAETYSDHRLLQKLRR